MAELLFILAVLTSQLPSKVVFASLVVRSGGGGVACIVAVNSGAEDVSIRVHSSSSEIKARFIENLPDTHCTEVRSKASFEYLVQVDEEDVNGNIRHDSLASVGATGPSVIVCLVKIPYSLERPVSIFTNIDGEQGAGDFQSARISIDYFVFNVIE